MRNRIETDIDSAASAETPGALPLIPPFKPGRARLLVIGCGAAVFLWLRVEDNDTLVAALFGLLVVSVALSLWLWERLAGTPLSARLLLVGGALVGAVGGLGTAVAAAALMLLKNGMHGHLFPDYPFGVIADTLARAPVWAAAGALLIGGLALAAWALRR